MKPAALAILLAGCLSHLPPASMTHMRVHWAPGWRAAVDEAQRRQKPILLVLAAGEITGLC